MPHILYCEPLHHPRGLAQYKMSPTSDQQFRRRNTLMHRHHRPIISSLYELLQRKHEIQIRGWTRPVTSRGEYNVNATYCAYCLSNRPYTNGVPNLQYKCMYTHHVFPAMGTQKEGRLEGPCKPSMPPCSSRQSWHLP